MDTRTMLLCALVLASSVQGISLWQRFHTTSDEVQTSPPNAADHPNGYWFATQNLVCVTGVSIMKRFKRSATRSTLDTAHRMVYYHGQVFEWGTGDNFFSIADAPASTGCVTIWEEEPAGISYCDLEVLREFTYEYSKNYGPYNLFTNNCHHYANRLSFLLDSSDCSIQSEPWVGGARRFWRMLGGLSQGEWPFEDILSEVDLSSIDFLGIQRRIEQAREEREQLPEVE